MTESAAHTGILVRTVSVSGRRAEVPTVHRDLTSIRAYAQSFAIGTPGDLIEYELDGTKGAMEWVTTGGVDADGHQEGFFREFTDEAVVAPAEVLRMPISQTSAGYGKGL